MKRLGFLLISFVLLTGPARAQLDKGLGYNDKGRRDPFYPLVDGKGQYLFDVEIPYSSEVFNLSGILWDPQGKSSALINNEVVAVGEEISGFIIKNITKDSVILSKGDKEFILRISIEEGEQK